MQQHNFSRKEIQTLYTDLHLRKVMCLYIYIETEVIEFNLKMGRNFKAV